MKLTFKKKNPELNHKCNKAGARLPGKDDGRLGHRWVNAALSLNPTVCFHK